MSLADKGQPPLRRNSRRTQLNRGVSPLASAAPSAGALTVDFLSSSFFFLFLLLSHDNSLEDVRCPAAFATPSIAAEC